MCTVFIETPHTVGAFFLDFFACLISPAVVSPPTESPSAAELVLPMRRLIDVNKAPGTFSR